MGSLECMFVGEQAKKLRETAGLTLEQVAEVSKLTVTDLQNFETGELYSTQVIQNLYTMYFQAVELIYHNRGESFLSFLDKFSAENDLDNDSLQSTYFDTLAEILNNSEKSISKQVIKNYMIDSNRLFDLIEQFKQLLQESDTRVETLSKNLDKMFKTVSRYEDAYEDAHQAWMRNQDMAEILIDIITTNGLEDMIIEKVNELMVEEGDFDFPEHDEESYKELMHELKHRWDCLEGKK